MNTPSVPMIDEWIGSLTPVATGRGRWGESEIREAAFLHPELPPDPLISSVRAVLVRGGSIAVMHNPGGVHPVPGGRREPGETLLETLRREVFEETGCDLDVPLLLGFIHFRHLTPEPRGYPFPYPDFFQVVYAARVLTVVETQDPDGWEERVEFVPAADTAVLPFDDIHRAFIQPALTAVG